MKEKGNEKGMQGDLEHSITTVSLSFKGSHFVRTIPSSAAVPIQGKRDTNQTLLILLRESPRDERRIPHNMHVCTLHRFGRGGDRPSEFWPCTAKYVARVKEMV